MSKTTTIMTLALAITAWAIMVAPGATATSECIPDGSDTTIHCNETVAKRCHLQYDVEGGQYKRSQLGCQIPVNNTFNCVIWHEAGDTPHARCEP